MTQCRFCSSHIGDTGTAGVGPYLSPLTKSGCKHMRGTFRKDFSRRRHHEDVPGRIYD